LTTPQPDQDKTPKKIFIALAFNNGDWL
jgi:hypothetical protein